MYEMKMFTITFAALATPEHSGKSLYWVLHVPCSDLLSTQAPDSVVSHKRSACIYLYASIATAIDQWWPLCYTCMNAAIQVSIISSAEGVPQCISPCIDLHDKFPKRSHPSTKSIQSKHNQFKVNTWAHAVLLHTAINIFTHTPGS